MKFLHIFRYAKHKKLNEYTFEPIKDFNTPVNHGNTPSTPAVSCESRAPLSPVFGHSPHHAASQQTYYGDLVTNLLKLLPNMNGKF